MAKKEHHIITETAYIQFPIVVRFTGCDVDMAIKENMDASRPRIIPSILWNNTEIPIDESKLDRTPTSDSVAFCLNWLAGFVDRNEMKITSSKYPGQTELEELRLEVSEWDDLIQGQCSITVQCPFAFYTVDLARKAHHVVRDIFEKYVVYYK